MKPVAESFMKGFLEANCDLQHSAYDDNFNFRPKINVVWLSVAIDSVAIYLGKKYNETC